jgi:hypothetical protein
MSLASMIALALQTITAFVARYGLIAAIQYAIEYVCGQAKAAPGGKSSPVPSNLLRVNLGSFY